MRLAALIPIVMQVSIFTIVFALGLSLGANEATWALRHPRPLARAFLAMFVIMPLVAAGMAATFALKPAVKIALIALALSPIPPLLPKKQLKEGGEASQAVGFLVAASVLAIVITPAGLSLLAGWFGVDVEVPTGRIVQLVALTILLPLVAGLILHRLAPAWATRLAGPIGKLGSVLLLVAAIPILITTAPAMWSLVGGGTLAAFVAFVIIGLAVGHFLAGGRSEDRTVFALSTASRHPGIAITVAGAVAASAAVRPEARLFAPAILLYLVVGGIVSAVYLAIRRRSALRS